MLRSAVVGRGRIASSRRERGAKCRISAKNGHSENTMRVIVAENYDEMSKIVAEMVLKTVRANPRATLGLATGSTPIGCYKLLAEFCRDKKMSFSKVSAINLDEYVGLDKDDVQSYAYFMRRHLFDNVDINGDNTFIPDGTAASLTDECERYANLLQNYRRDLQILGLGSNGHIGFNEPNTPFDSVTHVVDLTPDTIADNSRLFDDVSDVPTRAITMGISEIMKANKIVVLASGSGKARAVYNMVRGGITAACPASVLRRHPDCTAVLDKSAAALLD